MSLIYWNIFCKYTNYKNKIIDCYNKQHEEVLKYLRKKQAHCRLLERRLKRAIGKYYNSASEANSEKFDESEEQFQHSEDEESSL